MKRYLYDSISIAPEDAEEELSVNALHRINGQGALGRRVAAIVVLPSGWAEVLLEEELDDETPTA